MQTHKRELWDNRPKSKKLIWKEGCMFCINEWEEKQYIIKETKYWSIRYNKYPYYWNKEHLMVIPRRHVEYTYKLNKEELKDFKEVELFMLEYYKWKEYYSFIRQTMKWRSIKHLHYHYITGHISYTEKDWIKNLNIKRN